MKYVIKDREAGNCIDSFTTLEAAKNALTNYEFEDSCNGTFVQNFYEIVEVPETSKTTKHTPGEWVLTKNNKYITAGEKGFVVAEITCEGITRFIGNHQEAEANARLIAAAPDLLEALRKAEAAISYLQQKFVTMEKEHDHAAMMSGHARRTIREAINKAIGE